MKKFVLLFIAPLVIASLVLGPLGCAKPAPAPAPAPAPKPAPTPAPTPAPAPAPAPAPKPAPAPAPEEKIVWTLSAPVGGGWESLAYAQPSMIFQSWLEEMTEGRLVLDSKYGLVPDAEVQLAVIDGRADIGQFRIPWAGAAFTHLDFGSLPLYFSSHFDYNQALKDPAMVTLLQSEYSKLGLVKVSDQSAGPQDSIWGGKPFATVDDFKGRKVRTSGALQAATVKLLGGTPVTMPFAELSDAIARGTVDGIITAVPFGFQTGLSDVSTYVSLWPMSSVFPIALVVNKGKFDALPGDLQQIVMEWGDRMTAASQIGVKTEFAYSLKGIQMEEGVEVITPSEAELDKAVSMTKAAVDEWAKGAGPVGAEFLAIAAKYARGAR